MLSYDQPHHEFREGTEGIWSGSATATGTIGTCQCGAHRDEERQGQTTESSEKSFKVTWGFQTRLCRLQESKGNKMIWPIILGVWTSDLWCPGLLAEVEKCQAMDRWILVWVSLLRRKWSSIRFLQIHDWWILWYQSIINSSETETFGDWCMVPIQWY